MPVLLSKASSVGMCLPLTSMYSVQLENTTCFSDSDLSVLVQVSALCAVPSVPHAASSAGRPRPRPPTAAPRRNRRRSRETAAGPDTTEPRVRPDRIMDSLPG